MMLVTDFKIIVKPNCSLTVKNTIRLVTGLAGISILVGVGFTLAGAWMVLPFAGLEIVAIAYAFYYIHLRADDFESITIQDDSVIVEKHGYKLSEKVIFQRYWARVNLLRQFGGKSSLIIGSHGKEVEFGRNFVTEEQREWLVSQIRQKLKRSY